MLNHALNYLKLGLSVIPLEPKGKKPLIKWEEFQKRKATEQEVIEWFKKWPNANVGVVTGIIGSVVIIDLDGPEGLQQAARLNISSSIQSITGNGKHLWYRYGQNSLNLIQNAVKIFPGVDIRGEGGYVVAPPSIHESGRRYRWLGAGIQSTMKMPVFPASVFADLQGKQEFGKAKEEGWIAKALEEMKDGNIDNTLTSILGRLRHDGWSASDAQVLLGVHADRVGAKPGHLEAKIENIWSRYEAKPIQYRSDSLQSSGSELIIHSPTNPDSIKQFEQSIQHDVANSGEFTTGYPKLDNLLWGGLKSSRLFTIAARTGVGKTNWLLGCAKHLCETGKKVLLFSTEMPYSEIWQRYLATLDDARIFNQHQFYVCDSFAPSIEKVEEALNEIRPDVFMFDHINHVSEEQRELGAFMQGLNFLRRKYECAGIVSAQLNRSADWIDLKTGEKVTPRMSMIKGSGTIEQASSRVLLLSETRVTPEMTEIVGNLDKNDNGPKGLCFFGLVSNPYRMIEL
jgi:hypothetical protein